MPAPYSRDLPDRVISGGQSPGNAAVKLKLRDFDNLPRFQRFP